MSKTPRSLTAFFLIACVVFGQDRSAVNASGTYPEGKLSSSRFAIALFSGQPVQFTFAPVFQSTLIKDAHYIAVPQGATQLRVTLNNQNADLDLWMRYGTDVALSPTNQIIGDYSSITIGIGATETIIVNNPQPGLYYIGYSIWTFGITTSQTVTATITQASTCTYSLSSSGTTSPATGATGSFTVSTANGCPWTASSDSSWLSVFPTSGNGPRSIDFISAVNSGPQRIGTITVAGQNFTVTQAGSLNQMPDNALLVSQFVASSGQWNTSLHLTNVSTLSEGYTIRFYDDAGAPKAMPIAGLGMQSVLTGTIAPGALRLIETAPTSNLEVAWAAIFPSSSISERLSGFATFRLRSTSAANSPSTEAIVGLTGPKTSKHVIIYDATPGYDTGVALVNADPFLSADVIVSVFADTGQLLFSDTLRLPPLGHTAFEVSTRYPITLGRRGTIKLNGSPRSITGLGFRFALGESRFTSFPLLTSPDLQ